MSFSIRRASAVRYASALVVVVSLFVSACGDDSSSGTESSPDGSGGRTLKISSIPDQDPQKLQARDGAMAAYLAAELGVEVEYVPVTDYAASVALFKTGDLDLVFYGGLTGVQARLQTQGATLVAQRDIDAAFESVFIASAASGVEPVDAVADLGVFAGKRFTFGSESSTSGRLMPEYFLDQAGIDRDKDFAAEPGFSGSHDKTIDLVEAGTYEGGALNRQVWTSRLAAGTVDTSKVIEVFVTPPYHDYHWIAGPETDERFGEGFTQQIIDAMLAIDVSTADGEALLAGYGAEGFIATDAANYDQIEEIGRKLGLVTG